MRATDFVSEILPEDKPLWHMTLVHDTLANRDLVIFRSHHAIGDGLSLVQMMHWIFDIQTKEVMQNGSLGDIEEGLVSAPSSRVYPENLFAQRSPRNSLTSQHSLTTANSDSKGEEKGTAITDMHTDDEVDRSGKEHTESSSKFKQPQFNSMTLNSVDGEDDDMGAASGRER